MAFEDYKTKESVVVMYTGEGKGKTSASLGLLLRSLGRGWKVAYIQFVKTWETGESIAIGKLIESEVFGDKFTYFKGGKGFYKKIRPFYVTSLRLFTSLTFTAGTTIGRNARTTER